MAQSFNAMLDRLEAVFRAQREFIEDASHELRDPLTICRGNLELLDEEPAEREQTVSARARRARPDGHESSTTCRLLAEAEQPGLPRDSSPVDLQPFAQQLLAKVSTLGPRAWALGQVGEATVLADRYRLTEAVTNLVTQCRPAHGRRPTRSRSPPSPIRRGGPN